MTNHFCLSISDLELTTWMQQQKENGTLPSLSLVLRDALLEKKKQWEEDNDLNVKQLLKKLDNWNKIAIKFRNFIDEKGLMDEFNKFEEEMEKKFVGISTETDSKLK